MSEAVNGMDVGGMICTALGLDPEITASVIITINTKEPVYIKVSQYVSIEKLTALLGAVETGKALENWRLETRDYTLVGGLPPLNNDIIIDPVMDGSVLESEENNGN